MTQEECSRLLAFVAHSWPTVPNRQDDVRMALVVWHAYLEPCTLDDALTGVKAWAMRGEPFPPTPGILAKEVADRADRARGVTAPDVDQAWAEVMTGVGRVGFVEGPPAWSHPAVDAAVRAVTWRDICLGDNLMSTRSQFVRMYDAARTRFVRETREPVEPLVQLRRVDDALALPPA